jgi:excisionase family DNA binding protein
MKETKVVNQGKYEGKLRSLAEAAKYLHMGVSTLYVKAKRGVIPSIRPPFGKYLFDIDELDAWLDAGKN